MKRENVLVICSHSDDHVIGAGGMMASYVNEGKNVLAIVLSYGEKSHPWLKERYTKKFRTEEAKEASKIIGCHLKIMGFEEGKFWHDYQKQKNKLLNIIRGLKPEKIFTHINEDPHPDHRAAYKIVLDLIKNLDYQPEVYLFSVWNPLTLKKSHFPKMYVDISETFGKKLQALKCFKSQRWNAVYPLFATIVVRAIKNGLRNHSKFAEKFYKLK